MTKSLFFYSVLHVIRQVRLEQLLGIRVRASEMRTHKNLPGGFDIISEKWLTPETDIGIHPQRS